jgi:hypothetical protein
MSRLELAAYISTQLKKHNIYVVLSGGSCVSIYSNDQYVSLDLDFVNAGFAKREKICAVMAGLGFHEKRRYFWHKDISLLVEFPPGPLGVGNEPVKEVVEIQTDTGVLLSVTK